MQPFHRDGSPAVPVFLPGLSGCWRDRTHVLGDGDHRDGKGYRCHHLKEDLPQCMDLISADEVCRRIELYFQGGLCRYLEPSDQRAARKGIKATLANRYDDQPLNLHNARAAVEGFVEQLKKEVPPKYSGRGIVMCAGGVRYFTCAWVCTHLLRQHGCRLPIQVWHLGQKEMTPQMEKLLQPLGVECVDATGLMQVHPARRMGGWELKSYALVHCPFSEVLFLDADNVPLRDPEYLFNEAVYKSAGAVFWPDYGSIAGRTRSIWRSCRLKPPAEREFESGQMIFNKNRCWKALRLSLWFNEHSDFFYRHMLGDKETFHLAFQKLRTPYHLIQTPIQSLKGIMCQHDFNGERIFQHRNTDKWNLLIRNKRVRGFRLDADCRRYLRKLQQVWDGGIDQFQLPEPQPEGVPKLAVRIVGDSPDIDLRLRRMSDVPIEKIQSSDSSLASELFLQATQTAKNLDVDYVLFLITPITINRYLFDNLLNWKALRTKAAAVASLTNRGYAESACHTGLQSFLMKPDRFQSQGGFLIRKDWLMSLARKRKPHSTSARSMIVQALSKTNEPLFQAAFRQTVCRALGPGNS